MAKKKSNTLLYVLIAVVAVVILVAIFALVGTNVKELSPIERITLTDNNSTVVITKNKLTQEATIEMESLVLKEQINPGILDLTEVTTNFMCGIMQTAFFKNEGLGDMFGQWANMKMEIDADGESETTKDNILEGYEVTRVEFTLKDFDSKGKISNCVIDGPEESDLVVKYY